MTQNFILYLTQYLTHEHSNTWLSKVNKMIALLWKFLYILPQHFLLTIYIYETFVSLYLDYGDAVYVKVFNELFHKKLESVYYNAVFAMAGAIWELIREALSRIRIRISSQNRCELGRLCILYKIYKYLILLSPHNLIPINFRSFSSLRATKEIILFKVKFFFPFNDNWME